MPQAPKLADLQSRMHDVILGAAPDALAGVIADDRLGFARRLSVYRNNTSVLLRDALAANFPVVRDLVGEEFFAVVGRAYLRTHPPHGPCLFEYGAGFPDFIQAFPGAATLPYLADVARLEWAWNEAYHAANAPTLNTDALARVEPADYARLTFAVHPTLRVVRADVPIHTIWALHQGAAEPDATVDLAQGGETVMITRPDAEVLVTAVPTGTAVLAETLGTGEPLGSAFVRASQADPLFDGAHALTALMTLGALSAFELT